MQGRDVDEKPQHRCEPDPNCHARNAGSGSEKERDEPLGAIEQRLVGVEVEVEEQDRTCCGKQAFGFGDRIEACSLV